MKINVPVEEKREHIEIPSSQIIEAKIDVLNVIQMQIITIDNCNQIKLELEAISSIIQDIHELKEEPEQFQILKFEYNNVKLLYERFEIEEEMKELSNISDNINREIIILEEKQKDLKNQQNDFLKKQKELEEQYNKAEEKNNNLVYNLLGFLTAFSIVSAVVGVVTEINGVINIMLFMTFTILILLTTLIGLHNFYRNDNKRETKLQDNYFLWKLLLIISIILAISLGVKYALENKENIMQYMDKKIEEVIDKKVENKINEELAN